MHYEPYLRKREYAVSIEGMGPLFSHLDPFLRFISCCTKRFVLMFKRVEMNRLTLISIFSSCIV